MGERDRTLPFSTLNVSQGMKRSIRREVLEYPENSSGDIGKAILTRLSVPKQLPGPSPSLAQPELPSYSGILALIARTVWLRASGCSPLPPPPPYLRSPRAGEDQVTTQ